MNTIYLAGGCFWGVQKFFDQFSGVEKTEVGYANGDSDEASYYDLWKSGHAETVKVTYSPKKITLQELLEFYFNVIDPFSLNKQGPDAGRQYRTGIYYENKEMLPVIRQVMNQVEEQYGKKPVVEVERIENYVTAEDGHQKYLERVVGGYCHVRPNMFKMEETRPNVSTRIYVLRHGKTDLNVKRVIQGRLNPNMNSTGVQQANVISQYIKDNKIAFDEVYSSPLERAIETTEIVSGLKRKDIKIDDRIVEMNFGDIEGLVYEELPADKKAFFNNPPEYVPGGGGETMKEMIDRVGSFLEFVKNNHEGESVLITSHGAAIHGILAYCRNKDIQYFWDEIVGNCSFIEIDIIDGKFYIRDEKLTVDDGGVVHLEK